METQTTGDKLWHIIANELIAKSRYHTEPSWAETVGKKLKIKTFYAKLIISLNVQKLSSRRRKKAAVRLFATDFGAFSMKSVIYS